jgi:hypothetical protein
LTNSPEVGFVVVAVVFAGVGGKVGASDVVRDAVGDVVGTAKKRLSMTFAWDSKGQELM